MENIKENSITPHPTENDYFYDVRQIFSNKGANGPKVSDKPQSTPSGTPTEAGSDLIECQIASTTLKIDDPA